MWESALYEKLINDSYLTSRFVSTYNSDPSIFSSSAPENVDFPYIVFSISETAGGDSVVDEFDVTIHCYDFDRSAHNSRLAARRIVELLDREHLSHEYYKTIRIFKELVMQAARQSEDTDPRAQHYVIKFSARAGRKGWIDHMQYGKDQYGDVGYDQNNDPAYAHEEAL